MENVKEVIEVVKEATGEAVETFVENVDTEQVTEVVKTYGQGVLHGILGTSVVAGTIEVYRNRGKIANKIKGFFKKEDKIADTVEEALDKLPIK